MRFYYLTLLLCLLLALELQAQSLDCSGAIEPNPNPPAVLLPPNGDANFRIEINLKQTLIKIGKDANGVEQCMNTRTYNDGIPGPTIRVRPGQKFEVKLSNLLPLEGSQNLYAPSNTLGQNDVTNIHFHGLHIDGDTPSDDVVALSIKPGGDPIEYTIEIPNDHSPGTHWVHPHYHGSSTLQVMGGVACVIIVEDYFTFFGYSLRLPVAAGVDYAPEKILLFNQIIPGVAAGPYTDNIFKTSYSAPIFSLINGQIDYVVNINQNEWTRFRIVNAAFDNIIFSFSVSGCEHMLLSKDGIYIKDFPRKIKTAHPPPGGRADVMVRCSSPGYHQITSYEASGYPQTGYVNVIPSYYYYPQLGSCLNLYLLWTLGQTYLTETSYRDPGDCSCHTEFHKNQDAGVYNVSGDGGSAYPQGEKFNKDRRIHQSKLGTVAERIVKTSPTNQGDDDKYHPYHQHIIPFQVHVLTGVDDPSNTNGCLSGVSQDSEGYDCYIKVGDWHDTLGLDGAIRFNPRRHTGKMVFHCHILPHEDLGMMALEEIVDESGSCRCDWFDKVTDTGSSHTLMLPTSVSLKSFYKLQFSTVLKLVAILAFAGLLVYLCRFMFTAKAAAKIRGVFSGNSATADERIELLPEHNTDTKKVE